MFEYEVYTIAVGSFAGKPKEDVQDVIQRYAKQGWRLHTYAPLASGAGGQVLSIQLIFERSIL